MPGERKAPRKKDAGPRAVAVLQISSKGKVTLVPVAILIGGKFWDASAYKADPVPMAVDPQTVYEAEHTGNSIGLFTIQTALHSNAANAPVPWIATGAWHPGTPEDREKEREVAAKAGPVPAGMDAVAARPRLTRNPDAASGAGKDAAAKADASAASPKPPASTGSGSDDEPPRLTKPAASSSSSADAAPGSSSAESSSAGGAQPAPSSSTAPSVPSGESKPGNGKPANATNIPESDSGAKAVNRPQLRRGKPAESFAAEDVPGYSMAGAVLPADAKAGTAMDPLLADKDAQLIPAISDASAGESRPFTYTFYNDEEADRRKQMAALAQADLRKYVDAQTKATTTSAAAAKPRTAGKRGAAAKPVEAILENVKMSAFDVWTTNQPVFVYSADAHFPAAQGNAVADSALQYSILLVAYPDTDNNLHKIYSGITDKFHLDITPRFELIDAVDADGDGRGELLFREFSDAGTGWAIYRASGDKLWKMFDSLNPE